MKILMISDSPLMPTGFSRVSHILATHFAKKYPLEGEKENYTNGVFYQGINSLHIPLKYSGYQLLAGGKWSANPKDNWLAYYTKLYIKKIKPDVIFTLLDARSVNFLPDILKELNYDGKWIFYYPLDMELKAPWHKEYLTGIYRDNKLRRSPDIIITMSDFATELIKDWEGMPPIKKIYHGIDCKLFKPREPDQDIIRDLKLDKYKYVIGQVAMNQFRKMTYKTVFAFKEVKKKLKDVCLLLHTPLESPGVGWSIPALMDAFEVTDIIVNPLANFNLKIGVPDEYMARFYSVMDIHLLLTGGEGCGIPILESMACGKPNVLTHWTTGPELIGNNERGFTARVLDQAVGLNTEYRAVADHKDAAKKLLILLKDKQLYDKMSKNAIRFIKKRHDWSVILPKFDKLLKAV